MNIKNRRNRRRDDENGIASAAGAGFKCGVTLKQRRRGDRDQDEPRRGK